MSENTQQRPAGGPVQAVARRAAATLDAAQQYLTFLLGGSEIKLPPSFGARIRADFVSGVSKVAGKFVILLNIARVLSRGSPASPTTAPPVLRRPATH